MKITLDTNVLISATFWDGDFIITNDNHLLKLKKFEDIRIISPKEFISLFQA